MITLTSYFTKFKGGFSYFGLLYFEPNNYIEMYKVYKFIKFKRKLIVIQVSFNYLFRTKGN